MELKYMFCNKCGAKNEEGTNFCANCGHKLGGSPKGKIDFNELFSKYKYFIIGGVALLLVIILLVCMGGGKSNNPEDVVKNFMDGIMNCDADILDLFYLDEDELEELDMTEKEFKKELKKELNFEECAKYIPDDAKYKITDTEVKGKKATVKVTVTSDGDKEKIEMPLVKIDGEWYIDIMYFVMNVFEKNATTNTIKGNIENKLN